MAISFPVGPGTVLLCDYSRGGFASALASRGTVYGCSNIERPGQLNPDAMLAYTTPAAIGPTGRAGKDQSAWQPVAFQEDNRISGCVAWKKAKIYGLKNWPEGVVMDTPS